MPFTIYPAKDSDGEYVKYDDKDLNFGGEVNACVVPASATLPESAADVPTPASIDVTEWVLSTKRASHLINDEIIELKKRRRFLKKALQKSKNKI